MLVSTEELSIVTLGKLSSQVSLAVAPSSVYDEKSSTVTGLAPFKLIVGGVASKTVTVEKA